MEVDKGIKSDSLKKNWKNKNNPKFDKFIMKADVEYFTYLNCERYLTK